MSSFKGFTLIELLVVVAVIGILASVGVLSYNGYVSGTKRKSAENMMMAIGLAQTSFYSNYNEYYDMDGTVNDCDPDEDTNKLIGKNLFESEKYIKDDLGFNFCIYGTDTDTANPGYIIVATGQSCKLTMDQNGNLEKEGC